MYLHTKSQSGIHNAGVPVTADKVECIKTPAYDREGEELIIGEPAEDILVTHAPTEAPLNDTGI